MKQEWPKAIFGPNGEEVVVYDAKEMANQMAAWRSRAEVREPSNDAESLPRRGPGRPRKHP